MQDPACVDIYLETGLRRRAETGAHNFLSNVANVLTRAGLRQAFHDADGPVRDPDALALGHMVPAPTSRSLVFRRCYHYPFWQIEARSQRWLWDVAVARFEAREVPAKQAAWFYRSWQKRLFGEAPQQARAEGPVYVALQGRLLQHRSFQSCTPVEMLEHTLAHNAGPVTAALHPRETYGAEERAALETLAARYPQLHLTTGEMERHLQSCAYVVTMNSAAAFSGYFFGKPTLFFGEIDFHHIGVKANLLDLPGSFAEVATSQPDYAAYLWWFWQENCINAGRPEAEEKIAMRLRRFGWPV